LHKQTFLLSVRLCDLGLFFFLCAHLSRTKLTTDTTSQQIILDVADPVGSFLVSCTLCTWIAFLPIIDSHVFYFVSMFLALTVCLSVVWLYLGIQFITFYQHYSSISIAIYLIYHGVVFNIPLKIRYSISIAILVKLFSTWEEYTFFVRLPVLIFCSLTHLWIIITRILLFLRWEIYWIWSMCICVILTMHLTCEWDLSKKEKELFPNLQFWLHIYIMIKGREQQQCGTAGIYLCFDF